jgi:hypothetical protein
MAEKHIDGLTGQEFDSHEEYLAHVSPVTGYKPTDLEHHGLTGVRIAKAALQRTDSLEVAIASLDEVEEHVRAGKIENKLKQKRHRNESEFVKPKKVRREEVVIEGKV